MSFFDVETVKVWIVDSTSSLRRLKTYIQVILQRRLQFYSTNKWSADSSTVRQVFISFGDNTSRYTNSPVLGHVANMIEAKIMVHGFEFNPESSLRYLQFEDKCFDRETETFVDIRPGMHIAHTTGWAFTGFSKPGVFSLQGQDVSFSVVLEKLEDAFRKVRLEHEAVPRGSTYDMSDALKAEFDEIAKHVFELKLFSEWVGDWSFVVYELMRIARAVFGVNMAECLVLRSPERSGKDTTCNLIHAIIGTYCANLTYDALCAAKDGDSPCPAMAKLEGKRSVAVRECEGGRAMMASLFKRLCDPGTVTVVRELYKGPVEFHSHVMPIFCTNHTINLTKKDRATAARMAVIEYISEFADNPQGATQAQWWNVDGALKSLRPGTFWILWMVFRHLIKGRSMQKVAPVPTSCYTARLLNVEDESMTRNRLLLTNHIEPVSKLSEASSADDVDAFFADKMGERAADVRTTLQGLQLTRERSRAKNALGVVDNLWVYRYNFGRGIKTIKLNREGIDRNIR